MRSVIPLRAAALLALRGAIVLAAEYPYKGLYNGLAISPQMGWDNWNAFSCDVDEHLLLSTASKIVQYGLRDAGYHYVILDDCWSLEKRNATGYLQPNPEQFPHGMAYVADKLHGMGLGFGMYSSGGTYTCARYPASLGHEEKDARTFAAWGVDYLKYDNCYNEGQSGTPLVTYERYKKMSDALLESGRKILYSICNWGEDYPWKWAQTISNSWRMSGDITDSFNRPNIGCPCSGDEGLRCALPGYHCSAMNILNKVAPFTGKGIPGAWNDLDMLEVGNGGMDDEEYKTHFTMWAAVKSPLIMGNDVRALGPEAYSILTNPAVLAISQDPLGFSASRIWRYKVHETDEHGEGEISMWSGPLWEEDQVVILLNAGNEERVMNATLADVFLTNPDLATQNWEIYDLWANRMPLAMAKEVLNSSSPRMVKNIEKYYYNATEISYSDGVIGSYPTLLGKKIGKVEGMGKIQATVPRHGVAAFRLRLIVDIKRSEL